MSSISNLIAAVREYDPALADQLSETLLSVCRQSLLDFEGLLNEIDLNIFTVSGKSVGSIETLARTVSDIQGQSVEAILMWVRSGDNDPNCLPDAVPDWAQPSEFPHVIAEE